MTPIANLVAAVIAGVLTISMLGHPAALRPTVTHHATTKSTRTTTQSTPSYFDPAGTDAYNWWHGYDPKPYFPPPPPPAPVPEAAPADYSAPAAAAYVAPAAPSFVIGSTQQALINSDRNSAGLGGLNWSSCLAGIAYQNALRMANQGYISHAGGANQDLGCGLGYQGGENVGYWSGGINDYQLNTMFMNSPEHRANIMGPYHFVGTAWVVARNGYAYIAVEFN